MDFWLEMRAAPGARRFVDTDEDTRELLLRRILEAGVLGEPRARSFRWFVEVEGQLAGTVSARELSRVHGRVELGYMMADAYHGQGLCTRAVALMLEQLFTLPYLDRVWLTTLVENVGSQGVARKLGFALEGTLRAHCLFQGQRRDQQIWGLLRPEWELRRASLG
ncbi:acetyltransferase, GNAT family [Myxococcus hansupus]|uniref:Acetyltransferase, GNAT family n=1 Tax=Pseudomyxococcus hansupus TaxID=1297742 RepID=A0A0H4X474_9BACT|nr:acetyltransferase, GNAT family [Myxococcus hansupus]